MFINWVTITYSLDLVLGYIPTAEFFTFQGAVGTSLGTLSIELVACRSLVIWGIILQPSPGAGLDNYQAELFINWGTSSKCSLTEPPLYRPLLMQGYTTSWLVGGSEEGGNTVESFLATKNDRERPPPDPNWSCSKYKNPQLEPDSSLYPTAKTNIYCVCTKFLSVFHNIYKSTLCISKLEQNYLVYLTA
jgi:hypothetical protein